MGGREREHEAGKPPNFVTGERIMEGGELMDFEEGKEAYGAISTQRGGCFIFPALGRRVFFSPLLLLLTICFRVGCPKRAMHVYVLPFPLFPPFSFFQVS